MAFITGENEKTVRELLAQLPNKVKLVYFTKELECQFCRETRMLLEEIRDLSSGNVELEVYNLITDKEKANQYNVDKVPAIVMLAADGTDYGIRYYGIPSGYEFSSLLEDIRTVAQGEPDLSEESKKLIAQITKPLKLQVFVTPTCPYCPSAVVMAHKLAMANKNIVAEMVEASEFPHLAVKYNVRGVPRTMVGENYAIEGALPEPHFVQKVLEGYRQMYPENA